MIEVTEYAIANYVQDRLAFCWWAPDVTEWRRCIIKALLSQYDHKTHKYGIRIPKTIEEAYEIDRETGTDTGTKP